jgi:hypothetical protein
VFVRLSVDEWATLSEQADQWNSRLPDNASASAQMTVAKLLRSGALRRKRPPSVISVGVAAEALAEVKGIRADMARLGNMLKTWMEYGDGIFRGKGQTGQELRIERIPNRGELNCVRDVLKALEDTAATLNDQAARLGETRSQGE